MSESESSQSNAEREVQGSVGSMQAQRALRDPPWCTDLSKDFRVNRRGPKGIHDLDIIETSTHS